MKQYFVYGIYIGRRLVYIGVTKDPVKRFIQHYRSSINFKRSRSSKVHYMLNRVMHGDVVPRFKILEYTVGYNNEWRYILRYGETLFNMEQGTRLPSVLGDIKCERVSSEQVLCAYRKIISDTEKQLSFIKNFNGDNSKAISRQ